MARSAGDEELSALLDQFVCVRIVQGYGLDLNLFRFDFDMSMAMVFLNADGTVYGRYGTRDDANDAVRQMSVEAFKKAVGAALKLHADLKKQRKGLEGKRGQERQFKTPESLRVVGQEYPAPANNKFGNCMHCHHIREGEVTTAWDGRKPLQDKDLWPFPMPDLLGFTLDPREMATVTAVSEASSAGRAGLLPGDRILRLEGQPIVSIADVQWVLHHEADPGKLKAEVDRGGETKTLTLSLPKGWRRAASFEWRSSSQKIFFNILGFRCRPLDDSERKTLGLAPGVLALKVEKFPPNWMNSANKAAQGPLKVGDVIVSANGKKEDWSEAELLVQVSTLKKTGEKLPLTVLRGGKPVQVQLPLF